MKTTVSETAMCSYLGIGDLTGLPAHDLVTGGLPVSVVRRLTKSLRLIDERYIYKVLGITERAMQRCAVSRARKLNPHVSDRALRLVSVMGLAIEVLGSQDEAERWLSSPATGLDRRIPLDLLQSTQGAEMVMMLLRRMDYGVYA